MKNNNEITLRIKGEMEQFKKELLTKNFSEIEHFILYDTFMIPKDIDIKSMSTRDIIATAIIIRKVKDITKNEIRQDMSYKVKMIDDSGKILEQKSTRLKVYSCQEAEIFMNEIGYKKILNIEEEDYVYKKDNFSIATKDVKNGDNMIEIETNNTFDTIEKLIKKTIDENLNLDYSDYFVKKVELELDKVLKKK